MTKLIAFMKGRSHDERVKFQDYCLQEFAPRLLAQDSSIQGLVVDLVDVVPAHMPWQRPGELAPIPVDPPYDAAIEAWFETADQARDAARWLVAELSGRCARLDVFRTTEWIEKHRPVPTVHGRSPGVKYISQCTFHGDLPDSAARRSWGLHVPLALRVHVGVSKYVRNWVEEPLSPVTGKVQGIVELHFDSIIDLEQRWFDSECGRAEIIQDVGHFLKGAVRMFTTEHILRAPQYG